MDDANCGKPLTGINKTAAIRLRCKFDVVDRHRVTNCEINHLMRISNLAGRFCIL